MAAWSWGPVQVFLVRWRFLGQIAKDREAGVSHRVAVDATSSVLPPSKSLWFSNLTQVKFLFPEPLGLYG